MRTVLVAFVAACGLLAFVVAAAPTASACSCAAGPEGQSEADRQAPYDAVFTGRALADDRDDPRGVRWTFDVDGVAKGDVTDPESVLTSDQSAACGFPFVAGERFHVYANRDDDVLFVGLCSPTRLAHEEPALTPGGAPPTTTFRAPTTTVADATGASTTSTTVDVAAVVATVPTTVRPALPAPTGEAALSEQGDGPSSRTTMVVLALVLMGVTASGTAVAWVDGRGG